MFVSSSRLSAPYGTHKKCAPSCRMTDEAGAKCRDARTGVRPQRVAEQQRRSSSTALRPSLAKSSVTAWCALSVSYRRPTASRQSSTRSRGRATGRARPSARSQDMPSPAMWVAACLGNGSMFYSGYSRDCAQRGLTFVSSSRERTSLRRSARRSRSWESQMPSSSRRRVTSSDGRWRACIDVLRSCS